MSMPACYGIVRTVAHAARSIWLASARSGALHWDLDLVTAQKPRHEWRIVACKAWLADHYRGTPRSMRRGALYQAACGSSHRAFWSYGVNLDAFSGLPAKGRK